ncbi:putative nucleotidyltransferase [Caldanaerobacter subterraneus subsp. tengcongensis MB4]|uniref:Predicted nucleotidyltransferases n=1 Tax=Caldanaerobacter subterraneus subsp. tengcongensis (strain DSM 15242 / JCM 11007 / NBRC 100824 / MB4) TaxID=273068 RepID=Q8RBU6_CALS4|nr:nucleotidyltransferase domain-containing protein [Caldanaerobacter subterraneus]AAM23974.1 predicted nucleotidyltransferases [Caldanaerobacter subterraneus subsp. tengcongensis MB4]MCS3916507.1 putative nucleotidyltransferase [Caldanaerobacter subterraneus subsp. tengcongensis MB4]
MVQSNLKEVEEIFRSNLSYLQEKYDIKLVYVFGSYAKGTNRKNSDLDIAVLLGGDYTLFEKLELIGDLVEIFKRDDVDLVILNEANSVLRHQVIKYGKIIFEESEDVRVDFEVKTLREYMDMEYFRKVQMDIVKEWIKENVGENSD